MMTRMPWFRLYSEARNDAKLRVLADDEHRVWFNLLCLAAENDDRGIVPIDGFVLAVEVAGGDEDLMNRALDKLDRLDVLKRDDAGRLRFVHFAERQYDKPSDHPERVTDRVRRHRAAKATPGNAQSETGNADETPGNAQEKSREEKKRVDEEYVPPLAPPAAEPEPIQSEPNQPVRAVPKPRERPLPDGWVPSADLTEYAVDRLGLPPPLVVYETEKFVDYYGSKPSKKYSDWDATWRGWMRKAKEQAAPAATSRGSPNGARASPIEAFQAIADQLRKDGM